MENGALCLGNSPNDIYTATAVTNGNQANTISVSAGKRGTFLVKVGSVFACGRNDVKNVLKFKFFRNMN